MISYVPEVFVEGDLREELWEGLLHGSHGQVAGLSPAKKKTMSKHIILTPW
jgi:hypothetical protein